MANTKGNQAVNSFVKGFITEASPLTFPEGAALDELNFVLKHNGSRERRLGNNFEASYALNSAGTTTVIPQSSRDCFRWPNPNGSTKVDIGVVQLGRYIYFVNLLTANPSDNLLNGGSPIDTGLSAEGTWQFAILNNYLLALHASLPQPYLISYNDVTDVISYETAPIMIRDLYGVDDNIDVNSRPSTLTELHKYNLRNQGWSPTIVSTCGSDAIDCTFNTLGFYPSNSDQWGIGRIGDLTDANVNKYDPNIAKRNAVDGGQVPRGTYIIDLYNRGRDRNTRTGLTVPLDKDTSFASTIAGYAGRAWYSGIQGIIQEGDSRSLNLGNAVLYSQIFRNKEDLVKCFQEADPTSYQFSEVVDTDGGIIHIPAAINIVKLLPIKSSLFVFASNGVWEIKGGQDGFTATVFQVNQISGVGVYSPKSILEVNGSIFFWAIDGIFAITPNPNMPGVWDTTNLTTDTIQTYYNKLTDHDKKHAKGLYDLKSNTCRWLFATDYAIPGEPVVTLPLEVGTFVSMVDTSVYKDSVALTESLYVVSYTKPSVVDAYCVAATVDGLTPTIGTTAALHTGAGVNSLFHAIERISNTQFLECYGNSVDNYFYFVVGTVNPITRAITYGTKYNLFTGYVNDKQELVKLNDTMFALVYNANDANRSASIRTISVAGTVVTAGAQLIIAASLTQTMTWGCAIDDHTVFVNYQTTAAGTSSIICTRSGTTFTAASPLTGMGLYSGSVFSPSVLINGKTSAALFYQNLTSGYKIQIVNGIDGVMTEGVEVLLNNSPTLQNCTDTDLTTLPDGRVIVVAEVSPSGNSPYGGTQQYLRTHILDSSGGTISELLHVDSVHNYDYPAVVQLTATKIAITISDNDPLQGGLLRTQIIELGTI